MDSAEVNAGTAGAEPQLTLTQWLRLPPEQRSALTDDMVRSLLFDEEPGQASYGAPKANSDEDPEQAEPRAASKEDPQTLFEQWLDALLEKLLHEAEELCDLQSPKTTFPPFDEPPYEMGSFERSDEDLYARVYRNRVRRRRSFEERLLWLLSLQTIPLTPMEEAQTLEDGVFQMLRLLARIAGSGPHLAIQLLSEDRDSLMTRLMHTRDAAAEKAAGLHAECERLESKLEERDEAETRRQLEEAANAYANAARTCSTLEILIDRLELLRERVFVPLTEMLDRLASQDRTYGAPDSSDKDAASRYRAPTSDEEAAEAERLRADLAVGARYVPRYPHPHYE